MIGGSPVSHSTSWRRSSASAGHHRRRPRRARRRRPGMADELVEAGVKIIFNYSEALLDVARRREGPHLEPRSRAALRALLPPDLTRSVRSAGRGSASPGVERLPAPRCKMVVEDPALARLPPRRHRLERLHPQLAREWSRAGTTSPSSRQEPRPERYDLGGATAVRPDVGGLLPVFVLDRYEGLRGRRVQDCTRPELDSWVEANASAVRELLPADLVFTNHVLLGGPVGGAAGARFAVKAHGSELEYSMRGSPELSALGRRGTRGRPATFVGSAHIRAVLEEVVRAHVDACIEVPPGVDVDEWVPQPRGARPRGTARAGPARPPEPGQRRGAPARRGQRRAARRVPRTATSRSSSTSAADRAEGRPRPPRRARGMTRARSSWSGFGPERDALERRAAAAGWRRSSPGRSSTATCGTCSRSPTRASSRRSSPRRSGWSRPRRRRPAALRSSRALGPRRGRGRARGGLPAGPSPPRRLRTGDAADLAAAAARAARAALGGARGRFAPRARAAVVERWSWASFSRRLLEPFDRLRGRHYRNCRIDYLSRPWAKSSTFPTTSSSARRASASRRAPTSRSRWRRSSRSSTPSARPGQPLRGGPGGGGRDGARARISPAS